MKKIAIQGIAGSFHEDAARTYFGDEEIEVVECRSFQSVCELIDADEVDLAVMAIENSIAGSILQNYSLIRDYHLRIIGEIYIHIQMNLMMLPGAKSEDIKTIYSHPIAIRQCAEYIEKYF
ncbi:MAG TPA: prephenate dehydratase domain-containing protein, partial [Sunxiuqinia sp.]|nr:prephenate dehydratase domain-containing protein [Sunxiuqinia sp.]